MPEPADRRYEQASPPAELPGALREAEQQLTARLGTSTRYDLGVVTELQLARYALATGEADPLYLDPAVAREKGWPGLPGLPNYLTAVSEWGVGLPEQQLRPDGTSPDRHPGIPRSGIRLMGGGQHMRFHRVLLAGTHVMLERTLRAVDRHAARAGPMLIVHYDDQFRDLAGDAILSCASRQLLQAGQV